MSPNATELGVIEANFQNGHKNDKGNSRGSEEPLALKVIRSVMTLFTHIFIGIVVGNVLKFAFRNGTPLSATNLHLTLCVIGYHFLMAEAILSLSPDSWVSSLKLRHKKIVHLTMQIIGSLLAIHLLSTVVSHLPLNITKYSIYTLSGQSPIQNFTMSFHLKMLN
ncbi:unnamed protein product [Chilo suppressalis]|uniref:Cytochrome b561 domain-containing protein n=1 Tax=Chilo suppressalis TaxID=168631 RepID=A0ABN8B0K8_CHISP|nr:hypothetical protein evm_011573 [Chilo suppressalis]CAH0399991.1 unnamed protein product [Chilo suppressalis]